MPNNYLPALMQIRPQYAGTAVDTPENILFMEGHEVDGYTLAQLQGIQAVFDEYWPLMWKIQANENVGYTGSVITDWTSDSGLESNSVGTLEVVNGDLSGYSPAQAAVLISWVVGLRWRGGHFRTYLPGVASAAQQSESQILEATQTAMNTALAALITHLIDIEEADGGPVAFVGYRFRNAHDGVPGTPTTYPFVSEGVQLTLATQRRRVRKVTRK